MFHKIIIIFQVYSQQLLATSKNKNIAQQLPLVNQ